MRLKCVKGAKEIVENSPYLIQEPEKYKGNYKSVFNNDNPIYIEIGMGKGKFIIENAINNPNINYIGIEKYDSVIVRAVQKLQEQEIPNLKLIRMDAEKIEDVFSKDIDLIYLNFSDPWPKTRHERRRLSSHEFLNRYNSIFKDKKHIIQKTDNRKLFEFSIMSYTSYGYSIDNISLNLHEDDIKNNITTEYEDKFVSLGQPIYMIDVSK